MGTSTRHARSVALVLNIHTGHVSPQFHVKFDDFFETTKDLVAITSNWQRLAGFLPGVPKNASVTAQGDDLTTDIFRRARAKKDKGKETSVLAPRGGALPSPTIPASEGASTFEPPGLNFDFNVGGSVPDREDDRALGELGHRFAGPR